MNQRWDDGALGKTVKMWPAFVGLFGLLFALITAYNSITSNTVAVAELRGRVTLLERDAAVRSSQFDQILTRFDKMEIKLDDLNFNNPRK